MDLIALLRHLRLLSVVERLAPWVFAGLLLHHALRYAWVAEDAFINLRVVAQALDGWGLVWNQGERVQVYTSPLWLLLTLATSAVVGDPVQAVVWLSLATSAMTVVLLWQLCGRDRLLWLWLTLLWCASRSIRDYLCSGLEPPLVMVAIASAALVCAPRQQDPPRPVWHFGMLMAMCMLVRHDLLLLLGPLVVHAAWRTSPRLSQLVRPLVLGGWPFLLWSVWAWFYYGSPLPNTALAKIIDGWSGPAQAWHYFSFMQHFDPLVLPLMLACLALLWACESPWFWPVCLGVAAFLGYLARVGVDYMAGRFMVGPLSLCIFTAAHAVSHRLMLAHGRASGDHAPSPPAWQRLSVSGLLAGVLAFAAITTYPDEVSFLHLQRTDLLHDVIDTRQSFWRISDLETLRSQGVPHHVVYRRNADAIIADQARAATATDAPRVYVTCGLGITGYHVPRSVHIVDPLALSDRFLAGLPVVQHRPMVIGHFERPVPRAYLQALTHPGQAFAQPLLAAYFRDVQTVTQGELWSWPRLQAIWRLSSGAHQAELHRWQTVARADSAVVPWRSLDREGDPPPRLDRPDGCMGIGHRPASVSPDGDGYKLRILTPAPYAVPD